MARRFALLLLLLVALGSACNEGATVGVDGGADVGDQSSSDIRERVDIFTEILVSDIPDIAPAPDAVDAIAEVIEVVPDEMVIEIVPDGTDAAADADVPCVPDCEGKGCGDDGCSGECGWCPDDADLCTDDDCSAGQCVYEPVPSCCNTDEQCNELPLMPDDPMYGCMEGFCQAGTHTCVFSDLANCCSSNLSCSDNNDCTIDECEWPGVGCYHVEIPGCCHEDADCDDGMDCTEDLCVELQCEHINDLGPGCCSTDEECDDGKDCTIDVCVECKCDFLPDNAPGCCTSHDDCDTGGEICARYFCIDHECFYFEDPELVCCDPQGGEDQCDDGFPCSLDVCTEEWNSWGYGPPHVCHHQWMPTEEQAAAGLKCCEAAWECGPDGPWGEDGDGDGLPGPDDPGTANVCLDHQCSFVPLEQCACADDAQCDDLFSGTDDECVDGCVCQHQPAFPLCNTDSDCSDGDACTVLSCQNGLCVYVAEGCKCCGNETCDDGDPCSLDVCVSGTIGCVYLPNPESSTCCNTDEDCSDCDPTTSETCIAAIHQCIYTP
ncbi:MAG: hypothetical protein ABIK09_15050 [Pseudomonadota bacterium]